MHGLVSLHFGGKEMGLISEESVDWGGDEASYTAIYAAQRRGTPVLELEDSPGSDILTGELIELKAQNLVDMLGGSVAGTKWKAPAKRVTKEGAFKIVTADGAVLEYGRCRLTARIRGRLKHNEVLKVEFRLVVLDDGTDSPYSIEFGQVGG